MKVVSWLGNQADNLSRAQRDLKSAEDAERGARKAFEKTPRESNAAARQAWDAARRNVSDAEATVRTRQAEYDQSMRGQARSWV
jgi:vacuolar-type H+-ATPase subunit H